MIYDCVVVGAGLAGCTAAQRLSKEGYRVLVLEKRTHIGGNVYDHVDNHGILVHKYGPHIFHTSSKRVFDYLSEFTAWYQYNHQVLADVHGKLMPVPFNFNSLIAAYGTERAEILREKLISCYGENSKVSILELKKSNDSDLAELADYVYKNVFLYYTIKQWGTDPENIDPATVARVPVYLSYDNRYFQDQWQGMPLEGYSKMLERMLQSEKIEVRCNTDALSLLSFKEGSIYLEGEPFKGEVIYTGPVDELFEFSLGKLPYRTLDFSFESYPVTHYQQCGTINYTTTENYTRITEFKYLTGQNIDNITTIVKEYSREYSHEKGDIPYYVVANEDSLALYERYRALGSSYKRLHLLGRLAEYRYYNMDAVVSKALSLCDELLS